MATETSTGKYLDALPEWARELSEKYYSRSYALFVLYGNVRDLIPFRQPGVPDEPGSGSAGWKPGVPDEPGSGSAGGKPRRTAFLSLHQILFLALFGHHAIVLHHHRRGLCLGQHDSPYATRPPL